MRRSKMFAIPFSIGISYVPSTRISYTFRVQYVTKVTYLHEKTKHFALLEAIAFT